MIFTCLSTIDGDRVLERILFPKVNYFTIIKREKPSEGPKAFGAENELQCSIPGAQQLMNYLKANTRTNSVAFR